jgi:hypothetical protein
MDTCRVPPSRETADFTIVFRSPSMLALREWAASRQGQCHYLYTLGRFLDKALNAAATADGDAACFRIGSKFRCIRSTPTAMQSISENDFKCLASTAVNTAPMA